MYRFIHFGNVGLIFFTVCALLGYLITTDKTKYCNTQVLELSFVSPMQKACFKEPDTTRISHTFFERLNGIEEYNKIILATDDEKNSYCKIFYLGTDRYGRDLYSRLIIGIRFTMFIGFLSVIISLIMGILLGSLAGYFGGWYDRMISFTTGIFWSIPTILLAFVILMTMGRTIFSLCVSIGLTIWSDVARLVRGLVMQLKESNFIQSGKAMGFNHWRIIKDQILPNIGGPILVQASGNFALAVILESGLSFLGMGLQAPIPTLGNILQDQYTQAFSGQILQSLIPAIVLVLLILSFQMAANYLRDKLDVKIIRK